MCVRLCGSVLGAKIAGKESGRGADYVFWTEVVGKASASGARGLRVRVSQEGCVCQTCQGISKLLAVKRVMHYF